MVSFEFNRNTKSDLNNRKCIFYYFFNKEISTSISEAFTCSTNSSLTSVPSSPKSECDFDDAEINNRKQHNNTTNYNKTVVL